ncbi:hypothetical protein C8F01DRAFT_1254139 [Mycena amicta]|nr:hypothetical protein C8F01DRAFT_1254139 [Mycena amicta]
MTTPQGSTRLHDDDDNASTHLHPNSLTRIPRNVESLFTSTSTPTTMTANDDKGVPVVQEENDTARDRMPGLGMRWGPESSALVAEMSCYLGSVPPAPAPATLPPPLNTKHPPAATPAATPAFRAVRRRYPKLLKTTQCAIVLALHSIHPLPARNRRDLERVLPNQFLDDNAYMTATSIPLA